MKRLKKTESATIAEQLRDAMRGSGLSIYMLAKRSGVSWPILGRFLSGERGMTLSSAAKIASALNLELRPKGQK